MTTVIDKPPSSFDPPADVTKGADVCIEIENFSTGIDSYDVMLGFTTNSIVSHSDSEVCFTVDPSITTGSH